MTSGITQRAWAVPEEERGCARKVVRQAEEGKEGPGDQQDLAGADCEAGRDRVRLGLNHDARAAVGREL